MMVKGNYLWIYVVVSLSMWAWLHFLRLFLQLTFGGGDL